MQGLRALVFIALLGQAAAVRTRASPLSRVLQLMDSLAAKITKEGDAEAKAYKEYFNWCDDASRTKRQEIETATNRKAKLEAEINKETANLEASSAKIEDLAGSISAAEADLKNATTIRTQEQKDFEANEGELMDTVDTLGRAISIIEREMAKNPTAFAQMDTSSVNKLLSSLSAVVDAAAYSTADKNKLLQLVQARQSSENDEDEFGAPAAAVYKSKSGGILDVLEDLKEKAEEELSAARKAETNSKHNFNMLKQSLEDQMAADNKDLADEKAAKAAAGEAKASATGDLSKTETDLSDAKNALKSANENCMQVAADHEATVHARDEELKVIAQAKKILTESTSGAESQSYSMMQVDRSHSRIQSHTDLANSEVVHLVKKLAVEHHSAAIAQLASRISAVLKFGASSGEDPFVKVKGLISELISKLESEASSEATEKAYCDEQMAKTEEKKADLEGDSAKLAAKIDKATSRSAELKGEVKDLQNELAILAKEQADMDSIRQEAHADFVQAKADLETGLEGVRKALSVLRDYYGGNSASLVQEGGNLASAMSQPDMPEMHTKASGAGSSIIGILEVVESDFAKSLTKEETEEDDAQAEYEKTTQENKVTKTTKEQDVKYKKKEMASLEKSIADLTVDKDTTDAELNAVLEYYEKVKERCIAKPESYEERKARRTAEIQGLKEALTILEDETAFVQRARKGSGHRIL